MKTPLTIIRASAVYDLVVTAAFALPFTAMWLFDLLNRVHTDVGLFGVAPQSDDVYTVMFANLMGSVVVVWALFRIIRPSIAAGAADIVARILFTVGMINALLHGASAIVVVMLVLEIAWAITQAVAVISASRGPRHATPAPSA